MDRKIWAIVGIVFLQLSIIWFFRGSFQPEELTEVPQPPQSYTARVLRHVNSPKAPQIIASTQPDIVSDAKLNNFQPTMGNKPLSESTRFGRKVYGRPHVVQTSNRKTRKMPANSYAVVQSKFTDTIIVVKRADYSKYESGGSLRASQSPKVPTADTKPKRKTILARAFPVIKKPFVWMKALVSKL